MCRGGVGSILVMFDVLDCYILYMCLLMFVYCIPVSEAPGRGGRQNRIFFMFIGSPMNIRATWGRRGWSGLPRGSNIRPTWHQGVCRTTWHMFVGQVEPTNIRVLGSSGLPRGSNIRPT
jgi:hypothetical protein